MTTLRFDTAEDTTRDESMAPIIAASTIGSAIEWLDFFYYGFLSMTVFPAVFFPGFNSYVGVIASFTTNFVGFVARPLGSVFFGRFGDRVGRKPTLATTLLLIGIATMLIGVLPGYKTIGILAPLLLALLRFLQGVGVGGEWGGSVLLTMEFGNPQRRGFLTSWPQTGAFVGLGLSVASLLLFKNLYPGEAFQSVGWRMPFLLSTMLLLVGLYIRLRIPETTAFLRVQERQRSQSIVRQIWRGYWREILLSALVRSGEQAPFYIFTTFMLSYGVATLHWEAALLYRGLILASLVACVTIPITGALSDRFGRRQVTIYGALLMCAWAFPYFLFFNTGNPVLIMLAIAFSLGGCHACLYGPQAALIAERFPTQFRYTGATLGYQLASIIAGGPAPIIATYLLGRVQPFNANYPVWVLIALYVIVMALISLLAALYLKDYTGRAAVEDPA
ncbi:MFS transporter [Dictyobacter aurantiacus]|uniref:MFS transporter n=1 Tax=Dictyobacter aurantiacus TaxID=1936993 RepID=A0A401ZSQ2_9CHLR|nr:MFS transporter [Dictyobacter aurantiacus]GCE09897.1 MFS transporter [Dictyobacter aurantiacus]